MRAEQIISQHSITPMPSTAQSLERGRYVVLIDVVGADNTTWGGVEEHICLLGKHLHEQGITPLLLARVRYPAQEIQRYVDSSLRVVMHPDLIVENGIYPSRWRRMTALREVLIREGVDVYHIQSVLQGNEVWSALAARSASVASIICTYQNPVLPWAQIPRRRIGACAMHRVLRVRGIGVSQDVCQSVERWYSPPRGGMTCIFNAIDDLAENSIPHRNEKRKQLHIGLIGRLDRQKGVDTFLTAWSLLDPTLPVRASIIGDGTEREALERQATELGLRDRVAFKGWVPNASELVSEFDVVVMPSRYEGLPHVAVEACRAGVPVVATRVGGLAEIVHDGENGWLVPVDDPPALAQAITAAVRDAGERERRGHAGRAIYEKDFRVETMVTRTMALYERGLRRVYRGARA
jgi:glycosyltransferase involved in cell wall biosynthesis